MRSSGRDGAAGLDARSAFGTVLAATAGGTAAATASKDVPHALHLTFFPATEAAVLYCFRHLGQAITIVLAIPFPFFHGPSDIGTDTQPAFTIRSKTASGRDASSIPQGVAVASLTVEPRTLVALATYNECDNLAPLIAEIHAAAPAVDVLVIDDASPDGTGRVAEQLAAADPHIHVLHRKGKLGLGTAILAGLRYSRQHGYDGCTTMDADFSHHPRYLPALLAGIDRHDVMIGSRYVVGGGVANWPWSRRAMSFGVNAVVRLLMRIPAHDTSGGFRCYRVPRLPWDDLDRLYSHGYSFQEEVLYRCHRARLRIGETPIVFENRRAGSSKVNPRAARSMGVILWLGVRALFGFDESKSWRG